MNAVANDTHEEILDWKEVSGKAEWKALLLGNGASIAVHSDFNYKSLHEVAVKKGLLHSQTIQLFKALNDTKDFERVLLACWHAETVNGILGQDSKLVRSAYKEIRKALFEAVRSVHPSRLGIKHKLALIQEFCSQFETIVSFNYDLILYWAIVSAAKDETLGYTFKDCFTGRGGTFTDDWQGMRKALNGRKATLAFFGHGSLALVRDKSGIETKIASTENTDLLVAIAKKWQTSNFAPVFVSEGTAAEKQNAIGGSPYLRIVHNEVLPTLGDAVVIYGLGLNENDDHVVRAVLKGRVKNVAISVYRGPGSDPVDQRLFCALAKKKFVGRQVHFFDAQSSGVWTCRSPIDSVRAERRHAAR